MIFGLAILCSLTATYLAKRFAYRYHLVDLPDGRRKIQAAPVALAGGIGIFLGTLGSLLLGSCFVPNLAEQLQADRERVTAFVVACGVILLVGLIDDVYKLRARHKLIGQLLAVVILLGPGRLAVENISLFHWEVAVGWLSWPITAIWMLLAINALNLLDGLDGFLSTVGTVACGALAVMAYLKGDLLAMWLSCAFCGALIGFLRFNWPPATAYLGDGGSMLVGLVVGATSLMASLKGATLAILVPTCLLVLPMMDTLAAILRRKLTGRMITHTDRGHVHHMLLRAGLTNKRALVLAASVGGVAAVGSLTATFLRNDLFAMIAALAVVLGLLASGLFGTAEWRLLRERASIVVRKVQGRQPGVSFTIRLQGSLDWGQVWNDILDAAEGLNLTTVQLHVDAPAWHESYHGRLDRGQNVDDDDVALWRVELPLYAVNVNVGRLVVVGVRDRSSVPVKMQAMSVIVESIERRITELVAGCPVPTQASLTMSGEVEGAARSAVAEPKPTRSVAATV